jgi:hypothetical protein
VFIAFDSTIEIESFLKINIVQGTGKQTFSLFLLVLEYRISSICKGLHRIKHFGSVVFVTL